MLQAQETPILFIYSIFSSLAVGYFTKYRSTFYYYYILYK